MISHKIDHGINGCPIIPGDKSISHRAIIIPSISNGVTEITNILKSEDVNNTLEAFKEMGVKIIDNDDKLIIYGNGLKSLKKPKKEIYLGNSGTSARLLTGLLAAQNFDTKITGDQSLSKRPMKRIADPLSAMKAEIFTSNGSLPIEIKGKQLESSNIEISIPSAQIKSALLFAFLNTNGKSTITESKITRDHTEIMLKAFGADIDIDSKGHKKLITINGLKELKAKNIDVPCDLSSSAFFIVAALINKNSKITLKNININPTRNGLLLALEKMGARINYLNRRISNDENVCDMEISSSNLKGCELDNSFADLMIDEYPILSVAAAFADSPSIFRGLKELRVKESDRLNLIYLNLLNCGVDCNIIEDDLIINPSKNFEIKNNNIRTDYDHRIAMSFCVMGTKIGPLKINDTESINTSFPSFINEFKSVGGKIIWNPILYL